MKCHYCGHQEPAPTQCPNCGSEHIRQMGTGTQRVEEILNQRFPEARIIRMDVDTTTKKGSHEKLLKQFGEGKGDILLGTQMIAKGLDFPNITLVGVLNADTMLNLPDFRSSERTFQILTQVAGRAGRHDKKGEVIIQTYNPDHYAVYDVQQNDYVSFYQKRDAVSKACSISTVLLSHQFYNHS
ncbi:primosomal protein N' [Staphylococcus schleiferi]|uniref:Primosomal protein N n=1 Tax=Staphylococcus schleiferi TaxID=1295 RepID=A0A7Z7QQ79_STASC|nr:primosomal protein N' [Staphylococcus schleiferi]SUM89384.1 primosomal protein N' [Staphylococcus schleiferi]